MISEKTVVLITGANAGVGFASAAAIAAHSSSYHVIIGSRSPIKGQKAVNKLRAEGLPGTVTTVQLEVQNPASVSAAVKAIDDEFGRLDVLVNNAGLMSFEADYGKQLDEVFPINAFAPLLVTNAFVPLLKKSKQPRIVNVSSDLGSIASLRDEKFAWSFQPAVTYRMSKAALNMLTVCQSLQFEEWGAKVWSYCPGFVATNGWGDSDEKKQQMKESGAGDASDSGRGLLAIINGERDADAGHFVNRFGRLSW